MVWYILQLRSPPSWLYKHVPFHPKTRTPSYNPTIHQLMMETMHFSSSNILQLMTLLLIILTTHVLSEKCNPQDKKALLQIKKELGNPTKFSSWNPTTDCCNPAWEGVSCDTDTQTFRVVNLDLTELNLHKSYPIPPSIGNLPFLNFLFISRNPNLVGEIPPSITKLTKLHYIYITQTNISGNIPNFISQIKSLITIDFSHNNLTGPLPSSISSLPNLVGISFDGNRLTGAIPDSYGSFNSKLFTSITLSRNRLSGKIPASLGKLNLAFVDFSRNLLEGDASVLFGSKKNTQKILLDRNSLAFDIGKVGLSKNLEALDLRNNRIYGTLPRGLTALKYLRSLNVSYNNLCGEIPLGGKMQRFDVSAYASNKCLCGNPLPTCKN